MVLIRKTSNSYNANGFSLNRWIISNPLIRMEEDI